MFLEVFPCGPAGTNLYLLICSKTKEAAIIDAPYHGARNVMREVEKRALSVRMILLTHSHWDHIAEAALLQRQLQAPLYIHKEDAPNVEKPGADGLPLLFSVPPATPDGFLTDGQILDLGHQHIHVIHTPGHTPGSVCFHVPSQHLLFSGDTLFQGTIGNLSFPTARPDLMWPSLKRLASLPLKTKVYPGHGAPTTIEQEQWIAKAQERLS